MFFSAILSSLRLVKLPRKINYHNLQVLLSAILSSLRLVKLPRKINYHNLQVLLSERSLNIRKSSGLTLELEIFSLTLSLSVHRMVIWRSGWSGQKQERHSLKYLVVPESKEVLKKWCDFSSHVKSTQKYCKSTILQLKKFLKIK